MRIDIKSEDKVERIKELVTFVRAYEAVEELGWFEHTSDWDPTLLITLTDDTTIETASGYTEFELSNYKRSETTVNTIDKIKSVDIFVDKPDSDDCEVIRQTIDIDKIKSVEWLSN